MSPNRWILHLANGPPTVTTATVFPRERQLSQVPHTLALPASPLLRTPNRFPRPGVQLRQAFPVLPHTSPRRPLNSILPTAVQPTLALSGISQYPSLFPALTHSTAPHCTQDGVWNFISSVCYPEGPCGLIRRHTVPCQPQSLQPLHLCSCRSAFHSLQPFHVSLCLLPTAWELLRAGNNNNNQITK